MRNGKIENRPWPLPINTVEYVNDNVVKLDNTTFPMRMINTLFDDGACRILRCIQRPAMRPGATYPIRFSILLSSPFTKNSIQKAVMMIFTRQSSSWSSPYW
jgi:hypothetical protein